MQIHTKTHRLPPSRRDNLSPRCYLVHYLHPPPDPPLLPHPNLLYLVSSKDRGKKEEEEVEVKERGRCWWSGCLLFTRINTIPLPLSPRLGPSEVWHCAPIFVWKPNPSTPVSSYFGIRSGGRTGHQNPKRANCQGMRRIKGHVQIH